jgi:hypothetical protein
MPDDGNTVVDLGDLLRYRVPAIPKSRRIDAFLRKCQRFLDRWYNPYVITPGLMQIMIEQPPPMVAIERDKQRENDAFLLAISQRLGR